MLPLMSQSVTKPLKQYHDIVLLITVATCIILIKILMLVMCHVSLCTYLKLILLLNIDVPGEGGCLSETDMIWGIFWPATENNVTAIAACPGGSNVLGKSTWYYRSDLF